MTLIVYKKKGFLYVEEMDGVFMWERVLLGTDRADAYLQVAYKNGGTVEYR